MREIDLSETKTIQLELLDFLHKVCTENGIHYSLYGGTLLGAVRHKGYIPWDDDIDILMPRPDYERFIRLVENADCIYTILTPYNKKDYYFPFAKLQKNNTIQTMNNDRKISGYGINIDVFPIDGLPNDERKRIAYWNKIRIIKRINSMVYQKKADGENLLKQMFRRFIYFLTFFFPKNMLAKKIDSIVSSNPFEGSDFIACSCFGYGRKEEFPSVAMKEYIDLLFENKEYKAMKGYDLYLKSVFSDYMTLPPKEKQVLKHSFKAFVQEL